jgi:hypothetical protein
LDDDRRPPEGGDQPVAREEATRLRGGSIFDLGEQTTGTADALKEGVVGAGVRGIKPRRKNDHRTPTPIECPFVRRPIHPNRSARDDHHSVEHGVTRKAIREVERFIISAPGADDRDGALKIRQLAHDTKPLRRI